MTGEEALKRLEKQYKRQNEFIKQNYDRTTITFPKGTKDAIKARGETVNGLVNRLVSDWIRNQDTSPETAGTGFALPDGIKDINSPFI